ncbi:MAG: hypothetical protein NC218_10570, partial [Acetobacter sp.]|nr:hypothetical protein [Acetobacter sp.]
VIIMAYGIMRGPFMFSREKKIFLLLAVLAVLLNPNISYTAEAGVVSVDAAALPINATAPKEDVKSADADKNVNTLVSPSKPSAPKEEPVATASDATPAVTPAAAESNVQQPAPVKDEFDFDLKMKSINTPAAPVIAPAPAPTPEKANKPVLTDEDLPKAIEYKTNPIENLGNNILSQMDDDLFSQMSEIEKSTTLLTLELRREKIRNEIEAQKAIRQKAFDDLERQKEEAKLRDLEKKKQIEAKVLQEKQVLVDKQQMLEVLKQRKLLNAYMNSMLISQQNWLKEKENLYAQLAAAEQEKKELTELFKAKIEKLVDVSVQHIQADEAAKADFERVIKSLKARNEQLRKRIEADAKIIKNAQNSLYLKSQSIEELQHKNAAAEAAASQTTATAVAETIETDEMDEDTTLPSKLSAQYAILGITGRADAMSIEVIDVNGQPISLKVGSTLPSGHVLKDIGSDYAMFTRNGVDEYLYVGRTIDGFIPTLGLVVKEN